MQLTGALKKGNSLLFPLSRFLCVRHHSSANLFVAGLSWDTNESILRDVFEKHGEIIEVRVICDHVTAKSRGYGFVRFVSETAAATARKRNEWPDTGWQTHSGYICTQRLGTKSVKQLFMVAAY